MATCIHGTVRVWLLAHIAREGMATCIHGTVRVWLLAHIAREGMATCTHSTVRVWLLEDMPFINGNVIAKLSERTCCIDATLRCGIWRNIACPGSGAMGCAARSAWHWSHNGFRLSAPQHTNQWNLFHSCLQGKKAVRCHLLIALNPTKKHAFVCAGG